jgi:hypothetical protein
MTTYLRKRTYLADPAKKEQALSFLSQARSRSGLSPPQWRTTSAVAGRLWRDGVVGIACAVEDYSSWLCQHSSERELAHSKTTVADDRPRSSRPWPATVARQGQHPEHWVLRLLPATLTPPELALGSQSRVRCPNLRNVPLYADTRSPPSTSSNIDTSPIRNYCIHLLGIEMGFGPILPKSKAKDWTGEEVKRSYVISRITRPGRIQRRQ